MQYAAIILKLQGSDAIAFQRRDANAPTDPNVLALFGGKLEGKETPLEGAVREINEETSLALTHQDLAFIASVQVPSPLAGAGTETAHIYSATIPATPFEVYEGDGFETYTIDQFLARSDVSMEVVGILTELRSML